MLCLRCKAEVKSREGLYLELDLERRENVAKYATQMQSTDDWTKIKGIKPNPKSRLYSCKCFYHSEFSLSYTFHPDSFDEHGNPSRNLPWTCAGHPPFDADAKELADAALAAAMDPAKIDVVRGLYWRTHHGPHEQVVPDALATIAGGAAPLPEPLKALFALQTNLAPLSSFVEELIRYQTGIAKADPTRRKQVVDILTAAVWQRPSGVVEEGTMALLRDEALHGVVTGAQLRMFEVFDREWLKAQVEELVAKNPDHAGGVLVRGGRAMLYGSPDRDAAARALAALARKTGLDADKLLAQAEADVDAGTLAEDDSKRIVAAIRA